MTHIKIQDHELIDGKTNAYLHKRHYEKQVSDGYLPVKGICKECRREEKKHNVPADKSKLVPVRLFRMRKGICKPCYRRF